MRAADARAARGAGGRTAVAVQGAEVVDALGALHGPVAHLFSDGVALELEHAVKTESLRLWVSLRSYIRAASSPTC